MISDDPLSTPLYPYLEYEDPSPHHDEFPEDGTEKQQQRPLDKNEDRSTVCQTSHCRGDRRPDDDDSGHNRKLLMSFLVMVVVGSGNKVFQKLEAIPMYNYANFLNLLTTFMYIPLSFLYIVPVSRYGSAITAEQLGLPKKPFAVMGALDSLAGIMQTFAAVNLPGPLLILLPQAAIPISMALSSRILHERYRALQYVGAVVVIGGLLVVLEPLLTNRHAPSFVCAAHDGEGDYCSICMDESTEGACLSHHLSDETHPPTHLFLDKALHSATADGDSDDADFMCQWIPFSTSSTHGANSVSVLIWSAVMMLSCVPMALSSIYKEIALGEADLDPIFLNGWIALFQFSFSLVLAVPAGMASSPPVYPSQLPKNLYDGLKCYLGTGTIFTGCHTDDMCPGFAPLLVNCYLLLNLLYNILIIYILKFGSSNVLYLALTVMVPIGNVAFALPFMPGGGSSMHLSDILGLGIIMGGLVLYRFCHLGGDRSVSSSPDCSMHSDDDLKESLFTPMSDDRAAV